MKKVKVKKSYKRCSRQHENYKVFVPEFKTLIAMSNDSRRKRTDITVHGLI